MEKLLVLLILLSSCSAEKTIFKSKSDYVTLDGGRYIQAITRNNNSIINDSSKNQLIIRNPEVDTLYVFATVLDNENMFYSGKNLKRKAKVLIVDTYYHGYKADALHSGIRKFDFIELLPNDSLVINIDVMRLKENVRDFSPDKLKLLYYYFEKEGRNFDGLVDIKKNKLLKKIAYMK